MTLLLPCGCPRDSLSLHALSAAVLAWAQPALSRRAAAGMLPAFEGPRRSCRRQATGDPGPRGSAGAVLPCQAARSRTALDTDCSAALSPFQVR